MESSPAPSDTASAPTFYTQFNNHPSVMSHATTATPNANNVDNNPPGPHNQKPIPSPTVPGHGARPLSYNNPLPPQLRSSRYKEKFHILRDKFDKVVKANDEAHKTLEFALSKLRKLESENNLLLDALGVATGHETLGASGGAPSGPTYTYDSLPPMDYIGPKRSPGPPPPLQQPSSPLLSATQQSHRHHQQHHRNHSHLHSQHLPHQHHHHHHHHHHRSQVHLHHNNIHRSNNDNGANNNSGSLYPPALAPHHSRHPQSTTLASPTVHSRPSTPPRRQRPPIANNNSSSSISSHGGVHNGHTHSSNSPKGMNGHLPANGEHHQSFQIGPGVGAPSHHLPGPHRPH